MKITDFVKPSGSFLKAEEVKSNPTWTFVVLEEPLIVEKEYKGQKSQRIHIEGEFNKEPRIFDMSKTNARFVAKELGDDTKAWVGKELFLETYKTKTSDGKLTDAINVKGVKK
jgi:hypothetical protein